MTDEPVLPQPGTFALAGAVYARRDGKILVLKRAGGEMTGAWYVPGGGVDDGETPDVAARRELFEEAGLVPSGPLELVGIVPMHVYGRDSIQVVYACDVPEGEVVLSHEHSGFRWVDPREYRERYFGDQQMDIVGAGDPRLAAIVRGARENLDRYIAWLDHQFEDVQIRLMGLTADMFVVRDGRILLLKRNGGVGSGVWYVPGGVVDPGEQPADAAVRETFEEAGLRVPHPELLRVWSWPAQNNRDAYHAAYIAHAPGGDVVLSHEHTDHRWMLPEEYAQRNLKPEFETTYPEFAIWFREVRRNVGMVKAWIAAHA
jgi:8-oxo-dGTP pyrophosphatase MutT (NUDIX family)